MIGELNHPPPSHKVTTHHRVFDSDQGRQTREPHPFGPPKLPTLSRRATASHHSMFMPGLAGHLQYIVAPLPLSTRKLQPNEPKQVQPPSPTSPTQVKTPQSTITATIYTPPSPPDYLQRTTCYH